MVQGILADPEIRVPQENPGEIEWAFKLQLSCTSTVISLSKCAGK
jgi:hypothetical protein